MLLELRCSAWLSFLLLAACASAPPGPSSQVPRSPSVNISRDTPVGATGRSPLPAAAPKPKLSHKRPKLVLVAGIFPKPPELEPQVAFWRKVYVKWSHTQVVIHDNRHLNLIYQVVRLPEPVGDGYYTLEQKALIDRCLEYWRERLRTLETKLAQGVALNPWEEKLARYIAKRASLSTAIVGAAERVRSQRGLRERFQRGLMISQQYEQLFRGIFRQYNLPEELAYLPHVESSFQPGARSHAGAVGMWQFTPAAARTFIGNDSVEARQNPVLSAHGAARYLRFAYDQLGSWPLAITSYNHGIGGMKRAREQYGHDFVKIVRAYDHPLFGFASRNYYSEFLAACELASQPERFFPDLDLRFAKAQAVPSVQPAALERPLSRPRSQSKAVKAAKRSSVKTRRSPRRSRN